MKDSSNSSVNELIEAVGALSGDTYSSKRNDYNGVGWFDNTYIAGDNPSGMDFAQVDAYNIAMTFNESNTDLYNAWQSVSDCLEKISKKMLSRHNPTTVSSKIDKFEKIVKTLL